MICSYCKTENPKGTTICNFCKADLVAKRPKTNKFLSELEANRTQPELAEMHTYDLLILLRHLRAERSDYYRIMQLVRKAPKPAELKDYEQNNEYSQELYRELTARKNVVEEILVDRMGYYPKRIDDKLLHALKAKIERG